MLRLSYLLLQFTKYCPSTGFHWLSSKLILGTANLLRSILYSSCYDGTLARRSDGHKYSRMRAITRLCFQYSYQSVFNHLGSEPSYRHIWRLKWGKLWRSNLDLVKTRNNWYWFTRNERVSQGCFYMFQEWNYIFHQHWVLRIISRDEVQNFFEASSL